MGEQTGIGWTDHTWNPWIGCQAVSCACDFCYAEQQTKRWGGDFSVRRRTSEANWRQPFRWNRIAENERRRHRVFTCSMADFFDNKVPVEWRITAWATIKATTWLDWQILTKRPQNIAGMLPPGWGDGWPNVWLGVTAENQIEADRRVPVLLNVPAFRHFLSCEPLLGLIDLRNLYRNETITDALDGMSEVGVVDLGDRMVAINPRYRDHAKIDWIIAGGESGPHARPTNPDWFRQLRDICTGAGVPYFFKQWGEWVSVSEAAGAGAHFTFDDGATVRRIGMRGAPLTLDGRVWQEFPR